MDSRDNQHIAIDSLYRISSLVSDTDEPKIALQLILDEIVRVLKPKSASISLINPDSKELELEASHGLPEEWQDIKLALGQGVTGWTALHGRALIVNNVAEEPRYISVRSSIRSEMAVPMEDQGMVIGVVNVDSEDLNAYDESSLKILSLLTNLLFSTTTRSKYSSLSDVTKMFPFHLLNKLFSYIDIPQTAILGVQCQIGCSIPSFSVISVIFVPI